MNQQNPEQIAETMAAMSGGKLGPEPSMQEAAPMAPMAPKSEVPVIDQATTKGAPTTEADNAQMPPIMYKVKFGEDDERELSEKQITGTFERYGQMNEMNSAMRPILDLANGAMKANPGLTPEKFAKSLIAMANQHNPQMGGEDQRPNKQGEQKPQQAEDISKAFDAWEKDNAASLPPMYKEMLEGNKNTGNQMNQMMQMMQQVLGRSQGMLDAGKGAAEQAGQQNISNSKQRVANNLSRVQQKLGLPDSAENDFMMFASERGYTIEDFLDPVLTMRVAQDFKNGTQTGEVDRLREVQTRRQSFTGTPPQQPSGGMSAAPAAGDAPLEAMLNRKFAQ